MNPITNIKNLNKLNEKEILLGTAGEGSKSWHHKYKESAWIYIGQLPYDLTEGDIISVFSQYGEIVNINLVRDRKTGKSKGFCFLCYADQRSTILAVDNFNGIMLLKRMIKVDHVEEYKVPKYREDADEETKRLWEEGCAPKPIIRQKPTEEDIRRVEEAEERKRSRIVPLKKDEDTELMRKIVKKHKKKVKKEKKAEKKRQKKLKWLMEKAAADPEGDWKDQIKLLDTQVDEEDIYGQNEHFNFGKQYESNKRTHNIRPDFEKADWRDVEIWKAVRDKEKAAKAARGEKEAVWEEGEDYVARRHQ